MEELVVIKQAIGLLADCIRQVVEKSEFDRIHRSGIEDNLATIKKLIPDADLPK